MWEMKPNIKEKLPPKSGKLNSHWKVSESTPFHPQTNIISNLIVDMTAGNPAAVLAALNYSVFSGAITGSAVAAAWAIYGTFA